ncbi:hypothetical protein [Armatimonas sp.]|uniref:hypothetical protein n=1 Tax=Armatimonas sp. TaxID=1872638 RepID=UPI00286C474C|nr:hypothetical protein [Armatimonas sp.]
MEFRVFPEPAVKAELEKFIRVRLYTDNGSEVENKNGQYALELLNNAVNPLYAVIDGDGKLLANTDYNIAKDVSKMTEWLKKAL